MAGIRIVDENFHSDRHSTYNVYFADATIHTTLTSDSGVVTDWISEIQSQNPLIVGLDIEWRPNNSQTTNPAATLQICVGSRCLIFQLLYADQIPSSLINFLSNRNNTIVGVGIESDLEMLQSDHNFGFGVNWVDLRNLAADRYGMEDLKRSGVKKLTKLVLNVDMQKPEHVTRSRWDCEWLSHAQIKYAAVDAFTCSEIGRILFLRASGLQSY